MADYRNVSENEKVAWQRIGYFQNLDPTIIEALQFLLVLLRNRPVKKRHREWCLLAGSTTVKKREICLGA